MLKEEILYLMTQTKSPVDFMIRYKKQSEKIKGNIYAFLNQLCLAELTTLKGRIDGVKEVYNIQRNVPLYLNDQILLIPLNEENRKVFINFHQIESLEAVDKNKTKIIFGDESLIVHKTMRLIKKRMKDAMQIVI